MRQYDSDHVEIHHLALLYHLKASVLEPGMRAQYIHSNQRSAFDAEDIQCIVGHGAVLFGQAQQPRLADYADGVDTLGFLLGEV